MFEKMRAALNRFSTLLDEDEVAKFPQKNLGIFRKS